MGFRWPPSKCFFEPLYCFLPVFEGRTCCGIVDMEIKMRSRYGKDGMHQVLVLKVVSILDSSSRREVCYIMRDGRHLPDPDLLILCRYIWMRSHEKMMEKTHIVGIVGWRLWSVGESDDRTRVAECVGNDTIMLCILEDRWIATSTYQL